MVEFKKGLYRCLIEPYKRLSRREKCPYSKFLWPVFSHIWTVSKAQMRENTDQKNSKCGHFLTSYRFKNILISSFKIILVRKNAQ